MSTATAPPDEMASLAGKYLTFKLKDEHYGLEILKVQEIIGLMDITPVPRVPAAIRGVINLRGRIIPVIELRRKFEMSPGADTELTCIIVVQVTWGDRRLTMGVLVDEVSDVQDILGSQIEPTPQFGTEVHADFIRAVAKSQDRVIFLLDIEKVLTEQELTAIKPDAA